MRTHATTHTVSLATTASTVAGLATTRTEAFDADAVGFSWGEVPPPPWDCPTCSRTSAALALTDEGLVCSPCFQTARAMGRSPVIYDAVIWS